jgi:2,3-bisphosphoglycerate-dependent phosphoglycerate mutase
MNTPNRLVIVRHAESDRNKAKKGTVYFADESARKHIKGIPDHKICLTAKGEKQSLQTGNPIAETFGVFDHIFHSDYERIKGTVDGILKAYSAKDQKCMQVHTSMLLRERDPGYTYDMTQEEAESFFPWLSEYWQTFGGFFAQPPGGESLAQVCQRVQMFLDMLSREHIGENILIVTHGGVLRALRFLLENWSYEQALHPEDKLWSPANCGVTDYKYDHQLKRNYNKVFYADELSSDD